jgi:hypothetical protein
MSRGVNLFFDLRGPRQTLTISLFRYFGLHAFAFPVSFALQGQQQGPGFVVHMHQQNKESSSSSPAFRESAYGMESAFAKVVEGQQLLDAIMDDDSNSRIVTIQSIRLVGA